VTRACCPHPPSYSEGRATAKAAWRTEYPASAGVFDDGHGVRIVLPICPPSLNELKKRSGKWLPHNIRKAVRQMLLDTLLTAMQHSPGLNKQASRRRVAIVCYRGRELDADNTSAGCKPIVDELVEASLLRDDGPKWCDLRPVVQVIVKAKDQWRTEIYVEAI